jgi:glycosyltransferase involved in cell wall biosynthesis
MRATLAGQDYPREMIDVVRQAVPAADETWERLGRDRRPGRTGERLTVAFFGSAYPHKGPQLLVEAAQRSEQDLRVLVHGEVDERFAARLRAADRRGVVELCGAFSPAALPELLAGVDVAVMPSMWWDCAPLMAAECLAGRVPLVVPRLGGLGEAIRDGVDGLFFDALDAGDLARQLDRLSAEPGLLERLQAGIEAPRPFAAYVDELEAYYAGERPSRSAADTAAPAVTWQGDHGLHTSLSHINNEVTARLDGVQRLDRAGAPIDGPLPHAADVEVRHQWPPDLRPPRSGRLAVIQPWEFGAIPADWLEPLQRDVDELWVPSQFVRRMYLDAGVDEDRIHVVPNGVDLERFAPEGETYPLDGTPAVRFLFVGGAIARKGVDILLAAWQDAFAGRDDVQLVIKDFGSDGVYRGADRSAIHAAAQAGSVVHLDADLADAEMAALYRACDVLVHPYRGEGFAMPVLEAMASGLSVIHTGGGPTDEFCPPQAGWRLRAKRRAMPGGRVDHLETIGDPWMLEPDPAHLAELLRAAADADDRAARGAIGRSAALHFGWERIAGLYADRARGLAARAPRVAASDRVLDGAPSVLATPAWRAADELPALLDAWKRAPAGACLYLLADPATDGTPAELEARVMAAAAGIDLDACADVTILREHAVPGRDTALHAAADLYVPLHGACAGHVRLAGEGVVAPADLGAWLAARSTPRAA